MTGLAGLLTPGSTSDATFPGCARKRGCSAGSLTLTTKESLLEFDHLGLEHLDLGLQFLGTLDGALMLAAMIMSLLTQSDYFGLQQPIPLLERGIFLPQRACLRPARSLSDHHACGITIPGRPRRVPQKIAPNCFFLRTRSPNIYDLRVAVMACLSGQESRRWTVGELVERLKGLGVCATKASVTAALAEVELELELALWAPWRLVERGTEWILVPKSELLGLLARARNLPVKGPLSEEHKAVLLVVIGHRRKGGVSKNRIGEILKLDPSPLLDDLLAQELIYCDPSRLNSNKGTKCDIEIRSARTFAGGGRVRSL